MVAVLAIVTLVQPTGSAFAEEDWKSLKQESKRMQIYEMAEGARDELLSKSEKATLLFEYSYGWAVFDNLKLAFGFSGGGGNGVAVIKESGDQTYMKMGTAGIGLGLGINKYQVVFFFQDQATFDSFVNKGWQADATASAVAGKSGAEAKTDFINGMAIYQITDKGLMLHADIAGTKYWQNKKLNK
jgi:lipid-binding SYLF domain-containing protein